jgi:hypothetical protein
MSLVARERLEPEGITFIGSTYADVRHGVVMLDPQDERIEPDRIVSLSSNGEPLLDRVGEPVIALVGSGALPSRSAA